MPGLGRPLRGVHIKGLVRALTKTLSDSWGDPTGGEQQGAQLSGASHGGGYTTDLSDTLFKRAASAMESLLLALEDRLRQKALPFVFDEKDARSLMERELGTHMITDFSSNDSLGNLLGGRFPEEVVTSRQLRLFNAPGQNRTCFRLNFNPLRDDEHGELFVRVRDNMRDWRAFSMMNLWYRARSRDAKFTVTFKDAVGQRWFFSPSSPPTGGRWHLLRFPLANCYSPRQFLKDHMQHLEDVSEVSFQISCSTGSNVCRGWVDLYEMSISKA